MSARTLPLADVCARCLPPALVVVLCSFSPAAAASPQRPAPNLLLVTVDTLRPDALGWVAGSNSTPVLDALAARSFRFPRAVTPVPLTLPAHASLFTGLQPRRHGVRDNGQILAGSVPTLAEALRRAGYRTAAVVSGYPLQALYGLDRGFDIYEDRLPVASDGSWLERRAEATTARAVALLRDLERADGRPWFLWLHYFDPHDPYDPPEHLRRPGPDGAYLGEVAAVDAALGVLLAAVERAPRETVIVVTADHGESLGQHGEPTHGFFVYDATITVPLLLSWPGRIRPGESPAPARLIDLAPTVLDLLGLEALPETDGETLLQLVDGDASDWHPAALESLQPWLGYGWAPLRSVRTSRWKLIAAPRPELYDLAADPGERFNRYSEERSEASRLARLLADHKRAAPLAAAVEAAAPEDAERLAALGYLSGAGTGTTPPLHGLADPKERLQLKARLDLAEARSRADEAAAALVEFERVLTEESQNRFALLRAGQLLAGQGRLAEAKSRLEALVRLDPHHGEARYALAEVLSLMGATDDAVAAWREMVRLQPRRAAAWSNLAAMLLRRGETAAACAAAERAVELEPGDAALARNAAAAHYLAARAQAASGDLAQARRALLRAFELDPELRDRAARDSLLGSVGQTDGEPD